MNIKNILFSCFFFSSLCAMEKSLTKLERVFVPMWHVRSDCAALNPVSEGMLAKILPADQCGMEGTIKALIARPISGWRVKKEMLTLTKYGVQGDRHKLREAESGALQAVSLMRSDVSDALGGAPVPGDDLHVSGLDIGQKSLAVGGLIVIKDPVEQVIKVVLLKTAIEYYANKKIHNRCGQLAVEFLHAEGTCKRSDDYAKTPVHGLRDRLRGLKLAVLKEGEVQVGDRVFICNPQDTEWILTEYGLHETYNQLLERSRGVARTIEKLNKSENFERYMASWRAKNVCCNGKNLACITGIVALMVAIFVGGSF